MNWKWMKWNYSIESSNKIQDNELRTGMWISQTANHVTMDSHMKIAHTQTYRFVSNTI